MILLHEINFNSIKVRLEPNAFAKKVDIDPFQFHKGAIRTLKTKVRYDKRLNFNSIKVRLELYFVHDGGSTSDISIP